MTKVRVSKYEEPEAITSKDTSELDVSKYAEYTLNYPLQGKVPTAYVEDTGVGGTDEFWCPGHVYRILDPDNFYVNPNYFTEYSG